MKKSRKLKNFKIKHTKITVTIMMLLLVFSIFSYSYIFYRSYAKDEFAKQSMEIAVQNQDSIFRVSKVLFSHSANAIDNSRDHSLQNLSICQFSDIAIYIDNTTYITDLTKQNTIKELWIDNIKIKTDSESGTPSLHYKNLNDFGKFQDFGKAENDTYASDSDAFNNSEEKIVFQIVNTNEENENADYSQPTFFTDCSNPISLGYVNRDIMENFSISEGNTSIAFNGKLLKQAEISLEDLHYILSFDIHIRNYENQKFVYHASFDVDLTDENESLYGGYLYQTRNFGTGDEYKFFKESD